MGLVEYHKKRDFKTTPEPKGAASKKTGHKLAFVVQEHHATALHYDFRLEVDGVLKSWAVPKGPSLDPHQHHLAIQTEDHPFEYRNFEGVIPEGSYGAGNVIIWDAGWYQARAGDPADTEATMRAGLKKGHITFILHGKKLKGEFALIQLRSGNNPKAWLLVKKGDNFATTADVTRLDTSIKSHKRVDDLGAHGKLPDLSAYPKKTLPAAVKPMLSTLVDQPFDGKDWLFEVKWDGYRAVASKKSKDFALYSRNGNDFAKKFAAVTEALRDFTHDVVVDGEIVVTDANGASHFEWLQSYGQDGGAGDGTGQIRYYLFDILWCDGHDVTTMPLWQRKVLLKSVLPHSDILQYSDHIEAAGNKLFKAMQHKGLEGMVAKKADSPYQPGVRGANWLKIKTHQRQEVVIGGYTEPRGGRKYLGSLLVGTFEKGKLHYAGHSGGGIADDQRKVLQAKLAKLERKTSPFATVPKPNASVHWVAPTLVGEMEFTEWTSDGSMRHPSFKGLRPDKKPTAVHREKSKRTAAATRQASATSSAQTLPTHSNNHGLPFEPTHLDKVFFATAGYTKGDMMAYYQTVSDYILPYLTDRPCSLNRMPSGISGESFYQKNNPHLPEWVPHADIFSDSNNANLRWIVGGRLDSLQYMVQLGCVEINPWNSRIQHLQKPDWIVIDLDPDGIGFESVIQTALTVKQVCDEWRIAAYPKTSGKTGIHIYVPLAARHSYEQGRTLAHLIALEVNKRLPKITSVERMPAKRKRKIYLDFLQNREGQTLAAPYSLRPTPQATVSTPLHWDEVKKGLKPTDFTIKNTPARLKRVGDLWQPVAGKGISLAAVMQTIEKAQSQPITP